MAYLKKEQYDRRSANAALHMEEQKNIETLTEEQHELLALICAMRHELHCISPEKFYYTEGAGYEELTDMVTDFCGDEKNFKNLIKEVEIEYDTTIIEDIMTDFENGGGDRDDEWGQEVNEEYRNNCIEGYGKLISKMNTAIEEYLRYIDSEYGTEYCPTGALRIA